MSDNSPTPPQPVDKKPTAVGHLIASREVHIGPLPAPSDLEKYEKVLPGAADRIIAVFESQTKHRHECEKMVVVGQLRHEHWGQIMAFAIVTVAMGICLFLIYTGHSTKGFTAMMAILGGVAGLFIYGKRAEKQNESDENK